MRRKGSKDMDAACMGRRDRNPIHEVGTALQGESRSGASRQCSEDLQTIIAKGTTGIDEGCLRSSLGLFEPAFLFILRLELLAPLQLRSLGAAVLRRR